MKKNLTLLIIIFFTIVFGLFIIKCGDDDEGDNGVASEESSSGEQPSGSSSEEQPSGSSSEEQPSGSSSGTEIQADCPQTITDYCNAFYTCCVSLDIPQESCNTLKKECLTKLSNIPNDACDDLAKCTPKITGDKCDTSDLQEFKDCMDDVVNPNG